MLLPSAIGGDCELSCLESLSLGSKPMVSLSLAELPGNTGHIVLAMGGLDNKVHLYCGEREGKFIHSCELKGHTDWIRCLDFSLPTGTNGEKDSLLLVSSSQDRCIRLWKMALRHSPANSDIPYRKEGIGLASYIEGPLVIAGSSSYQISLESLLIGHEDWVYSVQWQPPSSLSAEGSDVYQPYSILSASMDKTMMIWQPEKTTGIWMNVVSVGELSHCALGFYGGHWSPGGDSILAHGYGGSFHLWRNVGVDFDNWQPQKVPSGHYAAVTDITWSHEVIMCYQSVTTRIFAPWKDEVCSEDKYSWHEIARPQVHGHDINCVTIIQGKGNHRFSDGMGHFLIPATKEAPQKSANDDLDTLGAIPDAVPVVLTEAPIEEQLAINTLWPESHKLYGHGNELFSLCCDHKGKLVASSCKAQSSTVAEIWLWLVGSWKAVGRLQSHNLTVTNMQFSYDNALLLAVSRDRQFSLFSIDTTGIC
ncbi:hypothetical protein IFM89_003017 [Coptis chinensis]|uniref:Elongator complex protein 2 n=1 Tax=Coptis chinensis TaxID=261450 RepID=A0A835IUK5_9MAGN|nr:hypothetical protein IFM89_003017 [Coptis chinensis]